jgi:hypothetical protein
MRILCSVALLAVLALVAPQAQASSRYGVITVNQSDSPVWITIQDLGKTRNLDWGKVEPRSRRTWESGNYSGLSYYHVRFQFMNNHGGTLCDTTIEIVMFFPVGSKAAATGYYVPGKGCWAVLGQRDANGK